MMHIACRMSHLPSCLSRNPIGCHASHDSFQIMCACVFTDGLMEALPDTSFDMRAHVSVCKLVHTFADMTVHTFVDMCVDTCLQRFVDQFVDMCVDTFVDTFCKHFCRNVSRRTSRHNSNDILTPICIRTCKKCLHRIVLCQALRTMLLCHAELYPSKVHNSFLLAITKHTPRTYSNIEGSLYIIKLVCQTDRSQTKHFVICPKTSSRNTLRCNLFEQTLLQFLNHCAHVFVLS